MTSLPFVFDFGVGTHISYTVVIRHANEWGGASDWKESYRLLKGEVKISVQMRTGMSPVIEVKSLDGKETLFSRRSCSFLDDDVYSRLKARAEEVLDEYTRELDVAVASFKQTSLRYVAARVDHFTAQLHLDRAVALNSKLDEATAWVATSEKLLCDLEATFRQEHQEKKERDWN